MTSNKVSPMTQETLVAMNHEHAKQAVRVWLRLLSCTTLIENQVSSRLRSEFDTTLPRFDLMAQLERFP